MRWALWVVLVAVAGCLDTQAPDQPAEDATGTASPDVPELGLGSTVVLVAGVPSYWTAPTFFTEVPAHPSACTDPEKTPPTAAFMLEVPRGLAELRVGAERPQSNDACMGLRVTGPDGVTRVGRGLHGREVTVENPDGGQWRLDLHVLGPRVDVRMRALGSAELPAPPPADVIQLPDLRPAPVWEIQFATPIRDGTGSTLVPVTEGTQACHATELARGDLSPCLRFSFATSNLGPGRLDLHYSNLEPFGLPRQVTQWMYAPDGHHETRQAGQAVLHEIHGHYHVQDVYRTELLKLDQDGSTLQGEAFKRGGCWGDYLVGDWGRFDQDPAPRANNMSSNSCLGIPTHNGIGDETMAISPGWMDVYSWWTDDNYVPFTSGDGDYLLRFTADPYDTILELNETNNVSYASFRVQGLDIEVLERGFGVGPTDLARIVVPGPWIT